MKMRLIGASVVFIYTRAVKLDGARFSHVKYDKSAMMHLSSPSTNIRVLALHVRSVNNLVHYICISGVTHVTPEAYNAPGP